MKAISILSLLLLLSTCSAPKRQVLKQEEKCLEYEPKKAQLEGYLYRKSFPGPPNYTDIKAGDEEEVYWLIKTTKSFCVNESKDMWEGRVTNQSDVQLIISSELGFYKTKRSLLNKKVIVTGTLLPQITGHHKTKVLIDVQTLEGFHE